MEENDKNEDRKVRVWEKMPGEIRKAGPGHIVITALLTGIGAVIGAFGSLAIPLGFVTAFWPAQAIQSVGSIWYGMWGGIASAVFPIIANMMSGAAPLPVSLAYIPGNLFQGILAGWAFRQFKCDPRLKSGKDWVIFGIVGVLGCNFIGAGYGSTVLRMFGLISPSSHFIIFMGWWLGNSIPSFILGAILLKYVSPLVIKTKTFCKGYWA